MFGAEDHPFANSDFDMTSNSSDGLPRPESAPERVGRRRFLLGAVGGLTLVAPLAALARQVPNPKGSKQNWDQLERTLKGKLLRPDAEGYAEAIKIWNLRYASTRPAGVALVADAKDIATAIAWARDNEVELVTRSGGHSYAGYSTTPGLVINLHGMTNVAMDKATGNLTTFGAAKNMDVAAAGRTHGRAIPGGQCPTVGVAGFVLGGGLGFHMRQHGLGIDSLLSTQIVTADGQLLQVSDKEHPDLFWALRGGGGGNFGVNTSFTFRTFAVPEHATTFSLTWEGEACVKAFLAFQELLLHAPDSLGAIADFSAEVGPTGKMPPVLEVVGQIVDTKEAAEKLFAPVIAAAPPKTVEFEVRSFWDAKVWLSEDTNVPKAFAERSRFHAKPLPEAAVAAIIAALAKAPIQGGEQRVASSFFAWGGAVAKVPSTATAFVHRKDVWLQSFDCSWGPNDPKPVSDRLMAWQDEFYNAMQPYASDRSFQNFPDPQLVDPLQAYYGENLKRLVEVKRSYDRSNFFRFAQSIKG
ncbi:MAG: FAD-dependent oxidoreductase [Phycisphaerae bacterium]|nr:FAD-dependent oxidoreductase [Phycisphaerae bacterium]